MNIYLNLLITFSLLACSLPSTAGLVNVPTSLATKWQDQKELKVICAPSYYAKVAAIEAGFQPIGFLKSTTKVPTQKTLALLSESKYQFLMIAQTEVAQAGGTTQEIQITPEQIKQTGKVSLLVPRHLATTTKTAHRIECPLLTIAHPGSKSAA